MRQKFRKSVNPTFNNPGRFKFGSAQTRELEVKNLLPIVETVREFKNKVTENLTRSFTV
jgi:hypothetical protein